MLRIRAHMSEFVTTIYSSIELARGLYCSTGISFASVSCWLLYAMVLYRVFQKTAAIKYYSTIFSKATLFQIVVYCLMIIPPFFVAYATNDFWHYTSSYCEQPRVQYLNQLMVRLGNNQNTTLWNSFDSQSLQGSEPSITFSEDNTDVDGLNDILSLTISFTNLNHTVQTVQLILFFQVDLNRAGFLEQFPSLTLQSLTYTSQSWAAPSSGVWLGGDLGLLQREPLPASGIITQYNGSLLNSTDLSAEELSDIPTVLSRYSERNVRVQWTNQQAVWSSEPPGASFTIQVELRYPPLTVTYQPNFWQYLKFAWTQYLAVYVVFWWVLSHVQSFVFENQVILTIRQRINKLHSD